MWLVSIHRMPRQTIMHVILAGIRLFFDAEGLKSVPVGTKMRGQQARLLLHRGPQNKTGARRRRSQE